MSDAADHCACSFVFEYVVQFREDSFFTPFFSIFRVYSNCINFYIYPLNTTSIIPIKREDGNIKLMHIFELLILVVKYTSLHYIILVN
jgi:hypothetical protein